MIARTVLAALLVAAPGVAAAACAPKAAANAEAAAAPLRAMYAAATADDMAGFNAVVTPDFYAFDNGVRMTGPELMGMVRAAHAAGKRYVWTVNEPVAQVTCDVALVTYVNRGSVDDGANHQPLTWLESALVRYQDGRWRIAFFHSTRAPPAR